MVPTIVATVTFFLTALFFVGYAAYHKANMDTVKDHYDISVYAVDKNKYKQEWFDPRVSWTNKNNFPQWVQLASQYLPHLAFWYATEIAKKKPWDPMKDFWHWHQTKMILSYGVSGALTFIAGVFIGTDIWGIVASVFVVYYIGVGCIWNTVFNYYYDHKLIASKFKK